MAFFKFKMKYKGHCKQFIPAGTKNSKTYISKNLVYTHFKLQFGQHQILNK